MEKTDTPSLNKKEIKVLEYIYRGFTSKEIAFIMHLSVETIGRYRRRLYKKTGKKNIVGLYYYAMEEGIYKAPKVIRGI